MRIVWAGGVLLAETARRTGLADVLSAALAPWRKPRAVHDPGRILLDVALTAALGGDCLADVAMLRAEPAVFGPVASDPTVSRLVDTLATAGPRALAAIRKARASVREQVWRLAGTSAPAVDGAVIMDIDGVLVLAHSEKQDATATLKTFGHHPLLAFVDHGPEWAGEPVAGLLRPGNAGSNTAARPHRRRAPGSGPAAEEVPARTADPHPPTRAGTHEFLNWRTARGRWPSYSIGMTISEAIHQAVLLVPASVWSAAVEPDGNIRDGAWVATNTTGTPIARLERRHRQRARAEDRIRAARDTGLRNLPLHDAAQDQVWLEIVQIAVDLLAWMAMPALTGNARRWEPKRLRLRLFSAAAQPVTTGRRRWLRLAHHWP